MANHGTLVLKNVQNILLDMLAHNKIIPAGGYQPIEIVLKHPFFIQHAQYDSGYLLGRHGYIIHDPFPDQKIGTACQSVGGVGDRYTCRIQGKESYLWFEKGRWFVAAKR